MATVLQVSQVKSAIGTKPNHRATLKALGLGRIGKTNSLPDRPEIRGMIAKVPHLIVVVEDPAPRRPRTSGGTVKVHDLKPAPGSTRERRRVGRGIAGKGGKTAGRGTKGQGARGSVPPGFEGGQMPLSRRIPKLKGFKNPFRIEYTVVNLDALEAFDGDTVSPETLRGKGLVHKHGFVKVLGRGELSRALQVKAHAFSKSAEQAIIAAGGTVEVLPLPFEGRPPARGNALTNR